MADKDVDGVIAALARVAGRARRPGRRHEPATCRGPCPADELAARWRARRRRRRGGRGRSGGRARRRALAGATAAGCSVVAGSLYLVGRRPGRLVDDPALRDPAAARATDGRTMTTLGRRARRRPASVRRRSHWGARTYVMGILNVTPDSFSGDGLLRARRPRRARPSTRRAGWSPRAPTCSTSAASRRAPDTRRSTSRRRGRPGRPGRGRRPRRAARHPDQHRHDEAGRRRGGPRRRRGPAQRRVGHRARTRRWPRSRPRHGVPLVRHAQPARADLRRRRRRGHRRPGGGGRAGRRGRRRRRGTSSSIRASASARPRTTTSSLLHDLARLRALGRPILLGTSRKSTIGRILDLPVEERLEGTLATTALGIAAGVDIVRVHDVRGQRPGRPGRRRHRPRDVADADDRRRWRPR